MWDRVKCAFPSILPRATRAVQGLVVLGLVSSAVPACTDTGPDVMPPIDSTIVASADVIVRIDPLRTYEYDLSSGRVDSVLTALWTARLPVEEAWLPLNYMCLDPRGPRLTVALERPSARMADHDFQLGNGRLACSQDLRQYVIGTPPGSFRVIGTVRFIPVEGGCWALRVNDTVQYEPLGLPTAFRVHGLEVRALLKLRDDLGSYCMVGRIAEVLDIEKR
ncbi:MAG: hypothetical protein OER90_01480 [Gemmatimonadota bacterium]|nr:hypothetical protein [Gemmatimonadota bacterium]